MNENENEKLAQITSAINKLDNKDFSLYFFTIDTKGNPNGAVANIYEHVKVLNNLGYKASILHADDEYHGVQDWLGSEYAELPHVSIKQNVGMSAVDFVIIPEIFAGLMEQLKGSPTKKIVFSQAYHYVLNDLPIGKRWSDYGFFDVITTSEKQGDYLKNIFPNLKSHVVPVSVPEYFKPTKLMKEPIITIVSRDQADALKIVKSFYLQFPTYKWVTFRELRGIPKKSFAEELGKSCLAIWIDDISGYGTFPLEAMESDTPVIGKIPTLIPEWMIENTNDEGEITIKNNGVWTNSLLSIPELIASYMKVWLEDSVPEDLLAGMGDTKGTHSESNQVVKIEEVYSNIVTNRKLEFETMLKSQEEKSNN